MKTAANTAVEDTPWFDSFTRWMLIIMFVLLTAIFGAAKYMDMHHMQAGGTDDTVNAMASRTAHVQAHPFVDLPGDAQVGAFSVANFFVGMIVGHNWKKLFDVEKESKAQED